MKIIIWLGCIVVYSMVVTALRMSGIILGGIPTVVLSLVIVFLPAPNLCRAWEKRKSKQTDARNSIYTEDKKPEVSDEANCLTPAKVECPESQNNSTNVSFVDVAEDKQQPLTSESGQQSQMDHQDGSPKISKNIQGVHDPSSPFSKNKLCRLVRKQPVTVMVLFSFCIVLSVICCYLGYELYQSNTIGKEMTDAFLRESEENDNLNEEINELEIELETERDAREKAEEINESSFRYFADSIFLNNYIGMIVEDGTKRYHKYGSGCTDPYDTYWAHNIEYCEFLGYYQCPVCWSTS